MARKKTAPSSPNSPNSPNSPYKLGGEEPRGFARMTPEERTLHARVGAYTRAATHDMAAVAAHARRGLWASWLRKADPDGVLSERERTRRAEALQKAHYARMSLARWGKAS